MLPNFDPNNNESGLKLLEDLTTNAKQIQEQVIQKILIQNSNTEYLKSFLHNHHSHSLDLQTFKHSVPVVNYEDIKPYIERIANGEPSHIISSQPITELLTRYIYQNPLIFVSSINFIIISSRKFEILQLRNFWRTAQNDAINS